MKLGFQLRQNHLDWYSGRNLKLKIQLDSFPEKRIPSQAAAQGVVGAVSGAYGNTNAFNAAIWAYRGGASTAAAIAVGNGVGTTSATAMGTAMNMILPTSMGGINPAGGVNGECGC